VIIREEVGPRDAPTVILVHGAGVAGWVWQPQRQALGAYRTVIVDLPDHGLSRAQPFTTIEAVADELAELVPAAGAHLVGHSLGAKVVLEVLARRPGRVRSAVVSSALVRPSALVRLMNSHALNAMSLALMQLTWVARLQATQFAFPEQAMTDLFVSSFKDLRAENLDRPMTAFASRLLPPPGLDRVTCPVLLTVGAKEVSGMRDSQRDLLRLLPTARSAVLEGAAHNAPWTHAAAYNRLLTKFLSGGAELTP
jgi:pimeloyl-ACP methyl ester carboxylesterase